MTVQFRRNMHEESTGELCCRKLPPSISLRVSWRVDVRGLLPSPLRSSSSHSVGYAPQTIPKSFSNTALPEHGAAVQTDAGTSHRVSIAKPEVRKKIDTTLELVEPSPHSFLPRRLLGASEIDLIKGTTTQAPTSETRRTIWAETGHSSLMISFRSRGWSLYIVCQCISGQFIPTGSYAAGNINCLISHNKINNFEFRLPVVSCPAVRNKGYPVIRPPTS